MSRTNSNSITSILIYFLNNKKTPVRNKLLDIFIANGISVPNDAYFYDGTYSPLKIKIMNKKKVDIYARSPGRYEIYLIIEIKAGINEDLQRSQKKNGEYEKTSLKENIPLLYIIPKLYSHKEEISKINGVKIIYWEDILKITDKYNAENEFSEQIRHFVEISEDEPTSESTTNLIKNINKLDYFVTDRQNLKQKLDYILRKIKNKKLSETNYEFGYYWDNDTFFLGYSYMKKEYTFSFFIAENERNYELGKSNFYFSDGWYFIPINSDENEDILSIKDLSKKKFAHKYLSKIDVKKLLATKTNRMDSKEYKKSILQIVQLKELYDGFLIKHKSLFTDSWYQNDSDGIGYNFEEVKKGTYKRSFFIGVSPTLEDKEYWLSIALWIKKYSKKKKELLAKGKWKFKDDWAFYPLNKRMLSECKSDEELQEKFNKNVEEVIKSIK